MISGKIVSQYIDPIVEQIKSENGDSEALIYYTLNNGKVLLTSEASSSLHSPSFNDSFSITLVDENSNLEFRVYAKNVSSNFSKEIDQFYIEGETLKSVLFTSKHYMDNLTTRNENVYTFSIKYKSDAASKIKSLQTKVEKKEEKLNNIIIPGFTRAQTDLENILSLRGVELIKNWGIFGSDMYNQEISDTVADVIESGHSKNALKKDHKSKTMANLSMNVYKVHKLAKTMKSPGKSSILKGEMTPNKEAPSDFSKGKGVHIDLSPEVVNSSEVMSPNRTITHNFNKGSSSKKQKIIKRKKGATSQTPKSNDQNMLNSSAVYNVPKLLTSSRNRRKNAQQMRNALENSLIYSAMIDLEETHRIKTEFRYRQDRDECEPNKIGKLFLSFDIDRILASMYSSVTPVYEHEDENLE